METLFINPVLHSVKHVLSQSTQGKLEIKTGKPRVRPPFEVSEGIISGVLSMSGPDGLASTALSFSNASILEITRFMMPGMDTYDEHMLHDLAGELTNMVIGDAKRQMEDKGLHFQLSLPVRVIGPQHIIPHRANAPIIQVPFHLSDSMFYVEAVYQKLTTPLTSTGDSWTSNASGITATTTPSPT